MHFDFKRDILPHLIGVTVFYIVVLFYFAPAVLQDEVIFQQDILQWEGTAKEVLDYREATGEEALWTNRLFGGMPAYLVSLELSGDITNFLTKVLTLGLPHPVNSLFFGMVAMYILLLSFKIRPEFSAIGAIAFAFNSFNVISLDAGHNAKIWAICLIPLILAGIHLALTNKKWLGLALFTLGLMLQLKFNHIQITYYTIIIVLIYGIGQLYLAFQHKTLPDFGKTLAILLIGAVMAVGANLSRIVSVYEYGAFSTRGEANLSASGSDQQGLDKEYAFRWSQGKLETMTLLVPYFYGGGSAESLDDDSKTAAALRSNGVDNAQIQGFIAGAPTYWGDQPGTGGPIYGGAIMVFLFVLGLIFAPKTYRYVFLSITILSLLLAWGRNLEWFNYAIFDYLPGYNKFRAVSMALGITLFAIPVLGCLGLENLFQQNKNKKAVKNLLIALAVTGGLCLLLVLFAGIFGFRGAVDGSLPDWLVSPIQEDRKAMLRSSAFRSLVFILLAAGLIFAALKEKINYLWVGIGIVLLMVIDLWSLNKNYLNEDSFQESPRAQFFAPTPADQRIMKDEGYFRVLNLENPFNEARTSYFFNSIGGYHGAKMRRYQELIENVLAPEIQEFIQKAQEGNFDYEGLNVLNMLNTKYIMAGTAANAVFVNPEANGPAWFPESVRNVSTNDEELALIATLDTENTATVNSAEFGEVEAGAGKTELESYGPNKLNYEVNAQKGGLVVFGEIYYPGGWKAFVNGTETEIIRTNYLLRGVVVPVGQSKVEMRFEPESYLMTKDLVVAFQYLIILMLIIGITLSLKSYLKP